MSKPLPIKWCIMLTVLCCECAPAELRVLVCELESESREHVELSSSRVRELGVAGLGQTSVVLVPKWKPLTRKQYDTVSTLWPTHFHEDKVYVIVYSHSVHHYLFLCKQA